MEAKTEIAEMRFLRNVAGYTTKDQIRYTKIREELNIFILNNNILKSRTQWKYHVQLKQDGRILNKILTYSPKIRRNIGRPGLRWMEQRTLREYGTDHT
jgi:hypothetical protein